MPLRTVQYVYYKTGDCSRIVIRVEGEEAEYDAYRSLSLHHCSNRSLKLAMWEQCSQDEEAGFVGFGVRAAREFKFDSRRAPRRPSRAEELALLA